jgi:integrase
MARRGSIRKKPNGNFEARYWDTDGRRRGKTFRTRKAASDFLNRVNADVLRGEYIDPKQGQTPFKAVAEQWLAMSRHLKPKTLRGYESIVHHHLLPTFGEKPVAAIKQSSVRAFLNDMTASGAQPGTVRNAYRALSPILALAVTDGYIRSNPCNGVKLPKAAREEMVFLTESEVAALATAITSPYGVLINFAAYTGLRAGEIAALKVERLDRLHRSALVSESVADVNGQLITGPTKNYSRRTVSLAPFLVEELTEYLETHPKKATDLLFTSPTGQPFRHNNFYGRHFRPAVVKALPAEKRGMRFHDLRHTCAAFLIAGGAHPKDIKDWLGHSSITVTIDRYGHRFPGRNAELASILQTRQESAFPTTKEEMAGPVISLR